MPPDMAPMLPTALQVALGGAIGATLRWSLGLAFLRALGPTALPLPILFANILGSTVMGAVAATVSATVARGGLAPYGPFVMTGLLGGFTTFSTFSLETVTLIERGQPALALLYVALSVGGALLGLWLGLALTRGAL